jgi:hypothetical protein
MYPMEDACRGIIREIVSRPAPKTLFDVFVDRVIAYHDAPCHSLAEMRARRNSKVKGDLFEVFCKWYLLKVKNYDDVWRLGEAPEDLLRELGMGRRDVGIDLITRKDGVYGAVQCKFKSPRTGTAYDCVNWKELSTFYALCARTNGNRWGQHVVMTNARYARHMGDRTPKDRSICCGTFRKLSSIDLCAMIPGEDRREAETEPDLEALRCARLKAFGLRQLVQD